METVKIINLENKKIVKEVNKEIAGDFIGTGEWKLYEEKPTPVSKEVSFEIKKGE